MEFYLMLLSIAAIAAVISGAITYPIYRKNKPAAVILGVVLFVVLNVATFIVLVIESGKRGHPF